MRLINHIFLRIATVILASCSPVSSLVDINDSTLYLEDDLWTSDNTKFSDNSDISVQWWEVFQDKQLDLLMKEFISSNYDLKIALLALDSSKSLSIINKSSLFPNISIGFGSSAMQTNNKGTQFDDIEIPAPGGETIEFAETSISENYKINVSSQWEVDLWGKMRSKNTSSDKNIESQKNDFNYFRLSIISQAVKMYFTVVQLNEQVALSKALVASNQEVFNIVEDRYNKGIGASLLDYRLSKSNLLISKASLEQSKMSLDSYKRQLESLVGRYPAGQIKVGDSLSSILPSIPGSIPSEIIETRPDILASYNKVESAAYELGYATKLKFPSFSLTNSIGTSSGDLHDIINGNALVWSIAGNALMPIFQNRKIKENEKFAETMYEKAKIEYYDTLTKSFLEIENKLALDEMLNNQVILLVEALEESEKTYDLAKERYNKGLIDLVTVIDSQKRMFDTRSRMILARKSLIENRIDLLICLGGKTSA